MALTRPLLMRHVLWPHVGFHCSQLFRLEFQQLATYTEGQLSKQRNFFRKEFPALERRSALHETLLRPYFGGTVNVKRRCRVTANQRSHDLTWELYVALPSFLMPKRSFVQ